MKTIFRAMRPLWSGLVHVHVAQQDPVTGAIEVATGVQMQRIELGDVGPSDGVLQLQQDEAQQLMDALWDVGLRPTEGSGSAGAMSATQKHLSDMQLIAMSALEAAGVKLKGER